MPVITGREQEQISKANASGLPPVVFVHGLWLLPSSWDRWATVFEEAGYVPLTPSWPDDPDTVGEANEHPEVFARKTVGQVADHYADVIGKLEKKPAVIGHSFGGLLSQMVAGRGLSAATVAIDSAPMRGVLPLPISALRAASPVLGNPANHHRAVPPSARRKPRNCMRPSQSPPQALRCSRRLPPTSTPSPRPRPTARTPAAGRC
jgi:non-heme chloroperoxidase